MTVPQAKGLEFDDGGLGCAVGAGGGGPDFEAGMGETLISSTPMASELHR